MIAWRTICIQRMASTGACNCSSVSSAWCSWASTGAIHIKIKGSSTSGVRRKCSPGIIDSQQRSDWNLGPALQLSPVCFSLVKSDWWVAKFIDSYPIGCEKRETRQLQLTPLMTMLGRFQTVFVLARGTFALVLVVASAVGSELSLSFSDDMSQKGGVGTKLWIVYLDCTTTV